MHFSEDDLKAALRRKDPGPGFTQRVMARVGQAELRASSGKSRRSWFGWLGPVSLRPVMTALAALVVVATSWLGYEKYREAQAAEARRAEQETLVALKIANAKLNHVFKRVNESINEPAAQAPRIRRQSL